MSVLPHFGGVIEGQMADNPYGLTGIPSMDLGLGGLLGDQTKDETEEQRKKRLAGLPDPRSAAAQQGLLGGIGGGLGNPASRTR
jgi:hypothetical protein